MINVSKYLQNTTTTQSLLVMMMMRIAFPSQFLAFQFNLNLFKMLDMKIAALEDKNISWENLNK